MRKSKPAAFTVPAAAFVYLTKDQQTMVDKRLEQVKAICQLIGLAEEADHIPEGVIRNAMWAVDDLLEEVIGEATYRAMPCDQDARAAVERFFDNPEAGHA